MFGGQAPGCREGPIPDNDVQLFDLQSDPEEIHNLALEPEHNRETILRLNALLNDLIAKEVGANDGELLETSCVLPRCSVVYPA
jgi:hypothetical protein